MRFRWKLLILLIIISLVPILTARLVGTRAVRRLGEDLVSRTRDRLVLQATQQMRNLVEGYSAILFADRERIEMALASLAATAERKLAGPPPVPADVLFVRDFVGKAGTVPSPRHLRRKPNGRDELLAVSFDSSAVHLAPGVSATAVRADIARLSGLTPVYKWIEKRLYGDALWYLTALEDGAASIYPGTGSVPQGVDQREQPWYRHALGGDAIPWSGQYVDPATRQTVVAATLPVKGTDGKTAGAVAVVVPIRRLLEHKFLAKRIPAGTKTFLCYLDTDPQTGRSGVRVYAAEESASATRRSWKTQIEDMWLTSGDPDQFEAMVQDFETGTPGSRRMPYQGCDCLWVYGRLNQFTSFLVFITPFETILKPAAEAQTTIQKRVEGLIRSTGYGAAIVLVVVFFLAMAFSRTVTKPLNALAQAALRLSEGDFDTRVEIRSRDEIGDMARVFNMVGPRLEEHAKMRESLSLAREVQLTLLPKDDPKIRGLDIAGKSFNCDETGGDYYDYLPGQQSKNASIAVLVGDVSGHGISAALLMTTARAFIRQRAAMGGSLEAIISDVNRQLTTDVGASGRFMTLFCCLFDGHEETMRWVRAGHDPAIFYDPSSGQFEELGGRGLPLGVSESAEFESCERDLKPGNIVLIGTDGIWEARNPAGAMLGKQAIRDIITHHAHYSAEQILKSVIETVETFLGGVHQEDDLTLVVVKATGKAFEDSPC